MPLHHARCAVLPLLSNVKYENDHEAVLSRVCDMSLPNQKRLRFAEMRQIIKYHISFIAFTQQQKYSSSSTPLQTTTV